MEFSAAWSCERCPCPRWGGWNLVILKVPSIPNCCVIPEVYWTEWFLIVLWAIMSYLSLLITTANAHVCGLRNVGYVFLKLGLVQKCPLIFVTALRKAWRFVSCWCYVVLLNTQRVYFGISSIRQDTDICWQWIVTFSTWELSQIITLTVDHMVM